jgi:hypothetical protein
MEASPKITSHSKFFSLTSTDTLNEYCLLLDKVSNSPNKYNIYNNDIEYDPFGNPYVIFQYYNKQEEQERVIKKTSFFGEIIDIYDLEKYDSLVNDHSAKKVKLSYIKLCTEKLKETFRIYYIVIYVKPEEGFVIEDGEIKRFTPKERNSK